MARWHSLSCTDLSFGITFQKGNKEPRIDMNRHEWPRQAGGPEGPIFLPHRRFVKNGKQICVKGQTGGFCLGGASFFSKSFRKDSGHAPFGACQAALRPARACATVFFLLCRGFRYRFTHGYRPPLAALGRRRACGAGPSGRVPMQTLSCCEGKEI